MLRINFIWVSFYWFVIGFFVVIIVRRSFLLVLLLFLFALSPSVFVFLGIIWCDVLFMAVWLLVAALAFATADCGWKQRAPAQIIALALLGIVLYYIVVALEKVFAGWAERTPG